MDKLLADIAAFGYGTPATGIEGGHVVDGQPAEVEVLYLDAPHGRYYVATVEEALAMSSDELQASVKASIGIVPASGVPLAVVAKPEPVQEPIVRPAQEGG